MEAGGGSADALASRPLLGALPASQGSGMLREISSPDGIVEWMLSEDATVRVPLDAYSRFVREVARQCEAQGLEAFAVVVTSGR